MYVSKYICVSTHVCASSISACRYVSIYVFVSKHVLIVSLHVCVPTLGGMYAYLPLMLRKASKQTNASLLPPTHLLTLSGK